jgi:hypothetical protein
MKRLLLLAVGLLLASTAVADGTRHPDVMPEQSIPLTFSHKTHIENGAQCQLCHSAALTSTDARDHNIPTHKECAICHRMEQDDGEAMFPKAACSTCHTGYEGGTNAHIGPDFMPLPDAPKPDALVLPPSRITFPHKTHIDQGVPCLDCHAGVDVADLATREHLPNMATCLGCHTGSKAPAECTTCHLQGTGGRILTDLGGNQPLTPSGRFRPDDHSDPRWLKIHQAGARADFGSCESCHATSFCLDCHDGTQKPLTLHPADWVMTHGLEAQRRTTDCYACHEVQADCNACHTAAAVVPGQFPSPLNADDPGNKRFHPEGWRGVAGEIPSATHHSHQARRALETCEACHGQDLCLECHQTAVNPHPESWAEPSAGFQFGQGDGQVCLTCHIAGDPNLTGIR